MRTKANKQRKVPDSIRRLFEDQELLAHDDAAFDTYLIEMVQSGAMRPTEALFCYAQRYDMDTIELVNVKLTSMNPRPAVLDFFDLMLNQGDISGLLNTLRSDRGDAK